MLFVITSILLWIVSGWLIARYYLSIQELILIVPVSMGLGSVLYFFFLNITLRILPVTSAALVASFLPFAFGLVFWFKNRQAVPPLQLSMAKSSAVGLVLLWGVFATLLFALKVRVGITDEVDFAPRATMIGHQGLNLSLLQQGYGDDKPRLCDQYHFAEAAVVGVLTQQAGMSHLMAISNIRVTYNMIVVLGLCFNWLWYLLQRKKAAWAILGSVLFIISGSAQWIAKIHAVDWIDKRLPQIELFENTRHFESLTNINFIHPSSLPYSPTDLMVSLLSYMGAHNPPGFWVLGFLLLLGWFAWDERRHTWREAMILGIGASSSALYFTTGMFFLVLPLGFFFCWSVITNPQKISALKQLVAFSGIGLLALIFQGGVITNSLFCEVAAGGSSTFIAQYLNFTPSVEVQNVKRVSTTTQEQTSPSLSIGYYMRSQVALGLGDVNFLNPNDWLDILRDWGFGLPLYALVFIYVVYRQNSKLIILFCSGALSIIVPFTFVPIGNRYDVARFAVLPIWIGCASSVLLFSQLWENWRGWRRIISLAGIVMVVFSLVFTDFLFINLNLRITPPASSYLLEPIDYQVQAEWFGKLDADDEHVWSPHYQGIYGYGSGASRGIVVFGTYGSFYNPTSGENIVDYGILLWNITGRPDHLNLAGYDYLYVGEDWYASLLDSQKAYLNDPLNYELIQTWEDAATGEKRWLYHTATTGDNSDPYHYRGHGFSPADFANYPDLSDFIPADAIIFSPLEKQFYRRSDVFRYTAGIFYEQGFIPDLQSAFELDYVITKTAHQGDLETSAVETLAEWRDSKDPQYLRELGIDYLFLDAYWIGSTSEAEYAILSDPQNYELLRVWKLPFWGLEIDFFYLYRVIP